MKYFTYAQKDATIYQGVNTTDEEVQNTGIDEILELEKQTAGSVYGNNSNSRILIKFDLSDISSSIASGIITSPLYYLNLYSTDNDSELPNSYTIYSYPVSQSWDMGLGRRHNTPKTKDGVSWTYRDGETDATLWTTESWAAGTTGSADGGGTWFTASTDGTMYSQSYEYEASDIRMEVTNYVSEWVDSTRANEGFIIKRAGDTADTDTAEGNTSVYGNIQFFSRDTNTIYPPKLEVVWEDFSWNTGSSTQSELDTDDYTLYMKGVRSEYRESAKVKFRLSARDLYPTSSLSSGEYHVFEEYYLPSGSSYYSVKDNHTEETLIDFDEYTLISADATSNYFNLWMNGLQPERFYRFVFKIVSGSGADQTTRYFDDDYTFKLVR